MSFRDITDADRIAYAIHNQYPGDIDKLVTLLNGLARPYHYEQEEDPADDDDNDVAAGKWWYQPSTNTTFRRNDDNDDWVAATGGSGGTPTEEPDPPDEPPDTTIINLADQPGLDLTGATDCTVIFQALLNNSPNGSEFRWPAGGTLKFKNITLTNRHYLSFVGVDPETIAMLWGGVDNEGIISHFDCTNFTYTDMGICNRAVVRFGGMRHFNCHNFTYTNCKIFDDEPNLLLTGNNDRYGIVFGFGGANLFSTNILIEDCVFDNLQTEVDHFRGLVIRGCTSSNSKCTAAFGHWARNHDAVQEDALIEDNIINSEVRSPLGAITFSHDVAALQRVSFQRIIIRNNTINHLGGLNSGNGETLLVNPGITFGAPVATSGGGSNNIYKDITIEGNTLNFEHGTLLIDTRAAIGLFAVTSSGWVYDMVTIRNNRIQVNNFTVGSHGIIGRFLQNSTIDGNVIINCDRGIVLGNFLLNDTLTDNTVINSGSAYRFSNALGGISFDTTNTYAVSPTPLFTASLGGTNVITGPTELAMQTGAATTDTTLGDFTDEAEAATNIFNSINDVYPGDDTDYIRSPESPSDDVYVTKIGNLVDPVIDYGHLINYRYRKDFDEGETLNVTVQLRQGYTNEGSPGTLIAEQTHSAMSGLDWAAGVLSLSAAQTDAITDYTTLYLRFVADVA